MLSEAKHAQLDSSPSFGMTKKCEACSHIVMLVRCAVESIFVQYACTQFHVHPVQVGQ